MVIVCDGGGVADKELPLVFSCVGLDASLFKSRSLCTVRSFNFNPQ